MTIDHSAQERGQLHRKE